MVKKHYIVAVIVALLLSMTGCSKKQLPTTIAYRSYPTECISKDPSGSLTLRVWGEGADAKAVRTNASKKAVEEVIFTNISGNQANALAVIPSPTARARHREYFNKFFKDGGNYKKYVKSEKPEKDVQYSGNKRIVAPVIVIVDREGLIDRFKKDKVIE